MTEVFIYDALRTPRGNHKISGALHEVRAITLLATVLRALKLRQNLDTARVDDGIFGCVTAVNDQGGNIAKTALLYADWDSSVGGVQINRYCCSGLDAVNMAALKIGSGMEDLIVAGGVESMSRVPMYSDGGPSLYDPEVVSKINYIPQGIAADLIATLEHISREEADFYALQSAQRALHAQQFGYFNKSLVPIVDANGLIILQTDERPRTETSLEILAKLKPSFGSEGENGFDAVAQRKYPMVERIEHIHTAGNSSGKANGAAAVLLGTAAIGKELGLTPRARVLSTATMSCEPTLMLTGFEAAVHKVLKKANLTKKDIDLWEINESFAAVNVAAMRKLELDPSCVNVNGGAIAFGHPLGATGAMLLSVALDELERQNKKRALITIAGGGMGSATIIERV